MTHHLEEVVRSYRVLGIEVGAPPEKAKNAYRKLIKVWHPDTCGGDLEEAEERTRELIRAFSRIEPLNESERRELRAFHHASQARVRGPSHTGFSIPFRPPSWRPRRRRTGTEAEFSNRCGRDAVVGASLTQRQNLWRRYWRIVLPTCRSCGGWGASLELDAELEVCPACDGRGLVGLSPTGQPSLTMCDLCGGRGGRFRKSCRTCEGTGQSSQYSVRFSIPAGIGHDTYGVLTGHGHPGVGRGRPGDLFLVLYLS